MPDLPGLPVGAWIRLRGPFGSGSGPWDRVEQREKGDRALHPTRTPRIPGCLESQDFLHPKSYYIPNLAESQTMLNLKPAVPQILPYPKPCHIPILAISQTSLYPKSFCFSALSQALPHPKPYIPNSTPFQTLLHSKPDTP